MFLGKKNSSRKGGCEPGFSMIEVIVSLFVIVMVLSIFSASVVTLSANQSNQNKNFAYGFAEAELAALNDYPFDSLTERTDGDFVGLAYNLGSQKIVGDPGAQSPSQVHSVVPASVMVGGNISSIALLPEGYYTDFTFSGYLKILSSSPADWQAGIIFRHDDINNYYFWSITGSSMKLVKVLSGTPSVLWSASQTFNTETWYKLKVVTLGTSLKVYLNDVLKIDQSDSSFGSGYIGFLGQNSSYYYLDSLHLESSVKNGDWFFDAEIVDSFPAGFLKITPSGLAGLRGKLTIENYGGTDIKKITAKVAWQEKGSQKEIQLQTVRSKVYE